MPNNRRNESPTIFHIQFVFVTALVFLFFGSILVCGYNRVLSEKWDLTPVMLLSFATTTAVLSSLALIGGLRLNMCCVLGFAIYMTIVSIVVIVLAFNRSQLIPVLVLVLVTTGAAFLYSNALRRTFPTRLEAMQEFVGVRQLSPIKE